LLKRLSFWTIHGFMSNRFSAIARPLAAVLVLSGALGSLGWLSWNAVRRSDFNFLPRMGAAEWILYPSPEQGKPHPRVEFATVFRCGFVLEKTPTQAAMRVAGFHRYTVSINGQAMEAPLGRGRNWKQPDLYE